MFQRRRRKESDAYLSRFFGRFTDRARRSIALAQEEAESLGRSGMAPEHLVLGMLRIPESAGARALAALGVSLEGAREDLSRRPDEGPSVARPSMEPETKWVLQLAVKEAAQLDDGHIGTEHILLALSHLPVVCSGPGGHSRVAPTLGLTTGEVRKEVFRVLVGSSGGTGDHPDPEAILRGLTDIFAENERLRLEVERLRAIVDERVIRPDEGEPGTGA